MGDQIPQLSPHAEVRKIADLTLYIAYENTWHLVQVKCPTLGTKFCIKSLGNAPPIPVLGGVGLNIDRCITQICLKSYNKHGFGVIITKNPIASGGLRPPDPRIGDTLLCSDPPLRKSWIRPCHGYRGFIFAVQD